VPASEAASYCGRGYGATIRGRDVGKHRLPEQFKQDMDPSMDHAQKEENDSMRWGTACEDSVRRAYAVLDGGQRGPVRLCVPGMVMHPTKPWFAASPDGVVLDRDDRVIEIKTSATNVYGELWDNWIVQGQIIMECTGRKECRFVVCFVPRVPAAQNPPFMRIFKMAHNPPLVAAITQRVEAYMDRVLSARRRTSEPNLRDEEIDALVLPLSMVRRVALSAPVVGEHLDFIAAANQMLGKDEPKIPYPVMP
jgi:hypothetical protein